MEYLSFLLGFLSLIVPECLAEYCLTYYTSSGAVSYYQYCKDGCCGSAYARTCCTSANVGAIAGGVIGALLVIAVIISIVVCFVFAKKRQRKKAKMIQVNAALENSTIQTLYTGHGYPSYHPPPNTMPMDAPFPVHGGPMFPRGTEPTQLDFHPPPNPVPTTPPPVYSEQPEPRTENAPN